MKRKVAKIGPATLMVSLPSQWAKEYGLKKGEEVDVEIEEGALIIRSSGIKQREAKVIDITGFPKRFVVKSIVGLYKHGYEEIKVIFKNGNVQNLKTNVTERTEDVLQEVVQGLIGFEIIEQKSTFIRIKSIALPSPNEFENVLRRIFLLIQMYMEESISAYQNKDKDLLQNLTKRKENITRFIIYATRVLVLGKGVVKGEPLTLHSILARMYDIVDILWFGNVEQLEAKQFGISKQTIEAYEGTYTSFKACYSIFYSYSQEKAEVVYKERRKVLEAVNETKKTNDVNSILLATRLANILNSVYRITEGIIGMKVK